MVLIGAVLMAQSMAAAIETPRYQVRWQKDPAQLHVNACFPSGLPGRLSSGSRSAADHVIYARAGERDLRMSGRHFIIPKGVDAECVSYAVDVDSIKANSGRRSRLANGVDATLMRAQDWLWQPDAEIDVAFDLPDGWNVSAPWKPTGPSHQFRVLQPIQDWPNLMAVGPFGIETLAIGASTLRVAMLQPAGSSTMNGAEIQRWLSANARAVAGIYGRFPLQDQQVLVIPLSTGGAVPWAQVNRGGATGVHFFVNEQRSHEEFMDDWTAAHEFSHSLHPYLSGSGRWVSEGLASYYQNVARARAGLITEDAGWKKLEGGFQRGRRAATQTPLGRAIRSGGERRNYMRIYWSGAALALLADVQLRRGNEAGLSVDVALDRFASCCLPANRAWDAREFLAKLDELTGQSVFVPLFDRIESAEGFPDVSTAYGALGISFDGGDLSTSNDPSEVALRTAIMGKRPSP